MRHKSYEELDFTDDFLFCRILMENEDLCVELAEMITGRPVRCIVTEEAQKAVRLTRDGKGVRFDVYFEDEDNVIYDIEMQTDHRPDLPERTRYYQGMIDLNVLAAGEDYSALKETFIIFICTFDAFDRGRHRYTFEELCVEDPSIRLRDGSHKIFLCTGGTADDCSEKMKDFLDYLAGNETSGALSARLRDEVNRAKDRQKWRVDYMTLQEHYREEREEGRREGLQQGLQRGQTTAVLDLLHDGDISKERAAEKLGRTPDEIDRLLTEYVQSLTRRPPRTHPAETPSSRHADS